MAKRLKTKAAKTRKRKARSNPAPARATAARRNPAGLGELAEYALPGFGGFAASRFLTRLAAAQFAKRWPTKAKHLTAVTALGSLAALWFFGHRSKWIAKYQMPAVVGSTIATLQSLLQLYMPNKLGWIVGDPGLAIAATQTAQRIAAQPAVQALPDHLEEISDDPRYYTYNDAYDAGRHAATQTPVPAVPAITPTADNVSLDDEEFAAGIFGGGGMAAGN